MTKREPAEVFHPGKFLRDELEARGWAYPDVVKRSTLTAWQVVELYAEQLAVTPEIAQQLAKAFDQDAQFWLKLQEAYDAG